jgi:acyl carrier protein
MEMEEITQRTQAIIRKNTKISMEPSDTLSEQLDSIDIAFLIIELESQYNVKIPPDKAMNDIREISAWIKSQINLNNLLY